jgi:hypothetical protein
MLGSIVGLGILGLMLSPFAYLVIEMEAERKPRGLDLKRILK